MKYLRLLFVTVVCLSLVSCSLTSGMSSEYPGKTELPPLLSPQGGTGDAGEKGESAAESEALAKLPTYQFDGRSFTVAVYEGCEFFPSDATDPYSVALGERNLAVEKKCGVSVNEYQRIPAESFYTDLRTAYESNALAVDALVVPVHMLSLFAVNGLLTNIYEVPFLDMNASYTHRDEMAAFSIGTEGFGYFSDIFDNSPFLRCLFVNERGISNTAALYDAALSGTFDTDAFFAALRETQCQNALAVDGDEEILALDLFCATGVRMIENDLPKTPILPDLSEKMMAFSAFFSTLNAENVACFDKADEARNSFATGESAFYLGTLTDASYFAKQKLSWGILPLPTDGAGKYYSRATDGQVCIAVMKNTDTSFSGKIINTLAAASSSISSARLSQQVYHALTSETAGKMYRLLQRSAYHDLGIDYGDTYATLAAASREVLVNFTVHGMEYEFLYKNANKSFTRFLKDYDLYD